MRSRRFGGPFWCLGLLLPLQRRQGLCGRGSCINHGHDGGQVLIHAVEVEANDPLQQLGIKLAFREGVGGFEVDLAVFKSPSQSSRPAFRS